MSETNIIYEDIEALASRVEAYIRPRLITDHMWVRIIHPRTDAWGLNKKAMELLGKTPNVSQEWRLEIGVKPYRRVEYNGVATDFPAHFAWIEVSHQGSLIEVPMMEYLITLPPTSYTKAANDEAADYVAKKWGVYEQTRRYKDDTASARGAGDE